MPKPKIPQSKKHCNKKDVINYSKEKNCFTEITVDAVKIKNMFEKSIINRIAKDTGFIQRKRILKAYNFFCP